MKDTYSDLGIVSATVPQVLSATDTSSAIDLQGFHSALVVINTGAIASAGDFTTKLQESDTTTSGDFTDVAAADLLGSFPASLAASSMLTPSQPRRRATMARAAGEFSPIPAVKTMRSTPSSAAVNAPIWRHTVSAK